MRELTPWPVYRDFAMQHGPTSIASERYNYAMMEAYKERLKLAMEALEKYKRAMPTAQLAAHVLHDIGPLPDYK